jgi:hypothetical protein
MAIVTQATQRTIHPDVYDVLGPDYNHTTAPIYNRLKKGPDVPDAKLFQYPFRLPVAPSASGSPEGVAYAAANTTTKTNRDLLYGRCHHKTTFFGVGEVAEGNTVFGTGGMSEFDSEMDLHLEFQINSAERIIIGEQESGIGNGSDSFTTRGLELSILDTARIALQTDTPTVVPAAFRPTAAQVPTLTITSNDYTLTEDQLMDPFEAIYNALKQDLDLDIYCTTRYKKKVSKFGSFVATPTETTVIRRFNNNSADKKIVNVVDTFTGDCGTARLQKHPYLRQDTSQKAEAIGVDFRFMSLRVRQAPTAMELKPEGSGRRGTTKQTFGLQAIPTYFAQWRRDD